MHRKGLLVFLLCFFAFSLCLSAEEKIADDKLFGTLLNPDQAYTYDDHGNRDPFIPLVTMSGSIITFEKDLLVTDMNLEGIMTEAGGNSIAIINGRILGKNDSIGSFEIVEIGKDFVVLQRGQKIYTLKLKKEE